MRKALLALVTLGWLSATQLQEAPPPELPAFADTTDAALQTELARRLNANPEWRRLIQSKKLAVGVVDLAPEVPRYARVNGNEMMYAASLPKIAILLAAYASFEDGSLRETPELHQDLEDMIRYSSNEAATRVMDAVGMRKIEQVMRAPEFRFYDEEQGGGLWVGKRYAAAGVRRGDPLHDVSHGATVAQVCRFYYELAARQLINAERSEQMLADLSDPGLRHKFVASLEDVAPFAKLFRKSGTWKRWHADSVLVQGPDWRNYILVAMVESPNGENILRELVPAVESALQRVPIRFASAR